MQKKSLLKKILYVLGSIVIFVLLAGWIFFAFFFQDTLNSVLIPKIEKAAFNATEGRYQLKLNHISYENGTLLCKGFTLFRVAYDTSERGTVLERVTIDSVGFVGLSWWDVLWENDLKLVSLKMNAPRIYLNNIDSVMAAKGYHYDTTKRQATAFTDVPVISFDSIVLYNGSIYLPKPSDKAITPKYENIRITLREFFLDMNSTAPKLSLFSKHIDFEIPGGSYSVNDSMYTVKVKGIHGRVSDSLVLIDTISYSPNYDKQAFADMHKYVQSSLDIKCTAINIRGIDFSRLLNGDGLHLRALEAGMWSVDYYGDLRKPRNPRPPDAVLPHTLLSSIKARVIIDSVILKNGIIRHEERVKGSVRPSLITFTNANVIAHPFCSDTSSPLFSKPMHFSVNAMFMGKGKLTGEITYPIHQKSFDLQMSATVGGFDLPVLNSYLVSNERKEVTSGRLISGEVRMDVKSGKGTTMVRPLYKDLNIKILADGVKEGRGIIEGLKTFIANAFILETENIDSKDEKALSATTSRTIGKKEEFFEYIWLALRKSILKMIGY
jgi:hypothetical protein